MSLALYLLPPGLPEERPGLQDGPERRLLGGRLPRRLQEEHRASRSQAAEIEGLSKETVLSSWMAKYDAVARWQRGPAPAAPPDPPQLGVGADPQQGAALPDVPVHPGSQQAAAPAAVQRLSGIVHPNTAVRDFF